MIARPNDTDFGLGGSVWSSDRDRAFEVAARITAGTVWVNKHLDLGPDTPYAGAKQSAIGTELGREGLEEFTQLSFRKLSARSCGQKYAVFQGPERLPQGRRIGRVDVNCRIQRGPTQNL